MALLSVETRSLLGDRNLGKPEYIVEMPSDSTLFLGGGEQLHHAARERVTALKQLVGCLDRGHEADGWSRRNCGR